MAAAFVIGTDEAGKGDYFGPLVVAAVAVPTEKVNRLRDLGVRDCKKLSDRRVKELSEAIKTEFVTATVTINPKRYNELYDRLQNLNLILAWAHARALENILTEVPEATTAIMDKFADAEYVRRALMKRGRQLQLVQRVRGEEEPVVAAASVVARAEFLRRLTLLAEQFATNLPKGASAAVEEAGRRFVSIQGYARLKEVAKVHFKTTSRLGVTPN